MDADLVLFLALSSFAIAIAAVSLSYGMIANTGPKISSWAMLMRLSTLAKMVGST